MFTLDTHPCSKINSAFVIMILCDPNSVPSYKIIGTYIVFMHINTCTVYTYVVYVSDLRTLQYLVLIRGGHSNDIIVVYMNCTI